MPQRTLSQVIALGCTQTLAWASSTYLPAILAQPIASELDISRANVFGAFSIALVLTGLGGPLVGRLIDRHGGRGMLAASNLVFAAGLLMLGLATNGLAMLAAWCVLGVGMAMGLYDAAFATLVRIHGGAAREPITGITLIAGFASTVGWPLTAFVAEHYGWRTSCFVWAAMHLFIALPVNLRFIPKVAAVARDTGAMPETGKAEGNPSRAGGKAQNQRLAFWLLAIFAAALGPAQVAARLSEFMAARRFGFHPLSSARLATALNPLGAVVLGLFGGLPLAAAAFAVLHGAGNGMITIAKGTLPLAIFGPAGYGYRQGLLNVIARGMQALAPFAFGLTLDHYGANAGIVLSAGVSLIALAALFMLHKGKT
ncbi:MAG: MFS transporter [Proteobacteria bacterium]|nr:MFS transporter [Pseudomonadota bacterium]